jgi:hypothetical protein
MCGLRIYGVEAEPRKAIPLPGQSIVTVFFKTRAKSSTTATSDQANIGRPVIIVQYINSLLVSEVDYPKGFSLSTDATENSEFVPIPLPGIPLNLVFAPE